MLSQKSNSKPYSVKNDGLLCNKLFLVRHGENRANLTKEFSHRLIDYPLTERGRLQAQQTAEYFQNLGVDEVYASPLKRARETAEIIAAPLGIQVSLEEAFREINVGELERMGGSRESWEIHTEIMHAWMTGSSDVSFPGGEDHFTAVRRMRSGLERILDGKVGQKIVIVAHGGIFFVSLSDLCPGLDMSTIRGRENQNCSISEIDMCLLDGRWQGELIRWADFSHLSGDAARLVSGLPEWLGEKLGLIKPSSATSTT